MIRNELMPKIISRWPTIGNSIGKLSAEAKWNQKILTEVAREDLDSIDASKDKINMKRLKSLSNERQKNAIVFWLNNENDFYVSSNNFEVYKLVETFPKWLSKKVNIFGPTGSGKTHLANILKKKYIF